MRGLRKGKNSRRDTARHRSGETPSPGELPGGQQGLGRVEYLPIEWHTRFKGRLYREGIGGRDTSEAGQASGQSTSKGEHSSERSSARGQSNHDTHRRQHTGGGAGGGEGSVAPEGTEGGVKAGGLSIWDITLPRAPTLRAFTNDTLLDILYFMSPEYHQVKEERNIKSNVVEIWTKAHV